MKEEEKQKHSSFGQIRFIRSHSNGMDFYGSELNQNDYISLEIDNSEIIRELTQDWYYPTNSIIRLRMSSNQFAELITSLNSGSGTPCTIERLRGEKIDQLPIQESRKDFVHRKFEDRMEEFGQKLKERQDKANEIIKKPKLSRADARELGFHIEWLTMEIEKNIPFFGKCFQENMDEVVLEAKTEIENAIQTKITNAGMESLGLFNNRSINK